MEREGEEADYSDQAVMSIRDPVAETVAQSQSPIWWANGKEEYLKALEKA